MTWTWAWCFLQRDGTWSIAGSAVVSDTVSVHYSKTLLNHVVNQRKTFYEDLNRLGGGSTSLADLESGVASPIFGLRDDVVGVLYGVRVQQGLVTRGVIKPLEAQLGAASRGRRRGEPGAVDGPADAGAVRAVLFARPGPRAGAR